MNIFVSRNKKSKFPKKSVLFYTENFAQLKRSPDVLMHLKNSISNVFFQAALVRTKSDEVIFKNFYKNYIYLKALPQVDQLEFDWSAIRKATDEERRQIREAVENGKINKMCSRKKCFLAPDEFSGNNLPPQPFASFLYGPFGQVLTSSQNTSGDMPPPPPGFSTIPSVNSSEFLSLPSDEETDVLASTRSAPQSLSSSALTNVSEPVPAFQRGKQYN